MIFQKTLRNEKDTDQFGMELALNLSKLRARKNKKGG